MRKTVVFILTMLLMTGINRAFPQNNYMLDIDSGGHRGTVNDIAVTKNGHYVFTASDDKTIRIWDAWKRQDSGKILGQIGDGYVGAILTMAISPGDRYLAVGGYFSRTWGSEFHTVRIYDLRTMRLIRLLKSHQAAILDLDFSSDGNYLVSGSADGTVKVWNVFENFRLNTTLSYHKSEVYGVKMFQNARGLFIVSAGYDKRIVLYSLTDKAIVNVYTGDFSFNSLAVNDKYIAASDNGKELLIFNQSLTLKYNLDTASIVMGLCFSPNGRYLLTGATSSPYRCAILDSQRNFEAITTFDKHNNFVKAVAFYSDKTAITAGGLENQVYFWDVATGKSLGYLCGEGKPIWAVGVRGTMVAYSIEWLGGDTHHNTTPLTKQIDLKRFIASDIKPQQALNFNRISVEYGSYSLSHRSGGEYNFPDAVLVIEKSGYEIGRIVRNRNDGYWHRTYGFTEDGYILSGGAQGIFKAYDLTGKEVADFIGHSGEIWSFAVDGDLLVTGSSDQTIKLWNLALLRAGEKTILPMLTVFVTPKNDWVVWSESGFFYCSSVGYGYIGYHRNRGADIESEYYKPGDFNWNYFSPDVISAIMQFGSEDKAFAYLRGERNISRFQFAETPRR